MGRAVILWRDVRVVRVVTPDVDSTRRRPLEGGELLAALHRLQSGEATHDLRFVNVAGSADVDWTSFPVVAALEAVTREEVRLLHELGRDTPVRSQTGAAGKQSGC